MARDIRTIQEFVDGPDDAPAPDRHLRGKIAEALRTAAADGVVDVTLEVRTTPAGTTSSSQLLASFCRSSDPPDTVVERLVQKITDELEDTFHGQLRVNIRDRHSGAHILSFARMIRPPPPASTTAATTLDGAAVHVLREPDAVRPWAELLYRALTSSEALVRASAELVKASHPPVAAAPSSLQGALLQGLTQVAAQAQGQGAAGAPSAPSPSSPAPVQVGAPSWPGDPPPTPTPSNVSSSHLQPSSSSPASTPITMEQVRAWAQQNPDSARNLVLEAMAQGAT